MTKASNNEFPSVLLDEQASAPTTPSTGFWRVYAKSDGLYIVDDAGSETGPFGTGGAGGSGAVELIEEVDLASDTATIEFSSIAATYSELRIEIVARSDRTDTRDAMGIRFGNTTIDSGNNYDTYARQTGETDNDDTGVDRGRIGRTAFPAANGSVNVFGLFTVVIPQYANTSMYKNYRADGGFIDGSADNMSESIGIWKDTSAIDIINLFSITSSNWVTGSVFRLYGVG